MYSLVFCTFLYRNYHYVVKLPNSDTHTQKVPEVSEVLLGSCVNELLDQWFQTWGLQPPRIVETCHYPFKGVDNYIVTGWWHFFDCIATDEKGGCTSTWGLLWPSKGSREPVAISVGFPVPQNGSLRRSPPISSFRCENPFAVTSAIATIAAPPVLTVVPTFVYRYT